MIKDEEKAEVFNAFFASLLNTQTRSSSLSWRQGWGDRYHRSTEWNHRFTKLGKDLQGHQAQPLPKPQSVN